jgi:integrase/recombinase XerD
MGHKVAESFSRDSGDGGGLYCLDGERKYLNRDERRRVLAATEKLDPEQSLFSLLLAWTGARVSEVLALTPKSFQVDASIVTILTLKRRKFCPREVPIPPSLMKRIEQHFSLRQLPSTSQSARLWGWHRVTAWRVVRRLMALAGVIGSRACPRGLRPAFGIATLQSGVPINLIQRWMGHARLKTTMIYMSVSGPEELSFARQFWDATSNIRRKHAAPRD